jgi:hypothetical protein
MPAQHAAFRDLLRSADDAGQEGRDDRTTQVNGRDRYPRVMHR